METYIPRDLTPVEAVQWDGSREGGNEIIDWVRRENMNARWSDWGGDSSYSIDVLTDEMSFTVYQNDWVVYESRADGNKSFTHMVTYDFEQRFRKEEQSNMVDHAKRELTLLGEEPAVIDGYLAMIRAFAGMGHSGGSASVFIPTLMELLSFKNLTELTDDPKDWIHHTEEVWGEPGGIWQNRRNGEAFSNDGGKTYYLLSSDKNPDGTWETVYSKSANA